MPQAVEHGHSKHEGMSPNPSTTKKKKKKKKERKKKRQRASIQND
jgi:hypothetical protein